MKRFLAGAALTTAAAGVACGVWGFAIEPHLFTVRRFTLPVLPAGARPLRILHVSDLHLVATQRHKMRWVRALADLEPDLVVNTGDNMAGEVLPELLDTYGSLLDVPGIFVLGSNDVYAPQAKNPAKYLRRPSTVLHSETRATLPTREMVEAFEARNWTLLDNRTHELEIAGVRIGVVGLGDAHMDHARTAETDMRFPANSDLKIGITHSPYTRVLDALTDSGSDVVFAGHTHGGQLRIPFWGAPVTNCDLPHDRARGMFAYESSQGLSSMVEISAGLGFSPYAPVRFASPPEVSLIDVLPGEPSHPNS